MQTFIADNPAVQLFACTCGKPDCKRARLRPLREHIRELFQAITACDERELFASTPTRVSNWSTAMHPLQMAAAIENVRADPSYAGDYITGFYCDTAWDADEEERELASHYTAALSIFNFVWMAYEASVVMSADGRYASDKVPVRARKILAEESWEDRLQLLDYVYHFAKTVLTKSDVLVEPLSWIETKYGLKDAAAGAELCRLFRNHVVHGDDPVPPNADVWSCYRFYAVSKLLLVLIQIFAIRRLDDPEAPIPNSWNDSDGLKASRLLGGIHLA